MKDMSGVEERLCCEPCNGPDTFGDDQDQPKGDHAGERRIRYQNRSPGLTVPEQTEPNGKAYFPWPERCSAETQIGRCRQNQPKRKQRIQDHRMAPAKSGVGWDPFPSARVGCTLQADLVAHKSRWCCDAICRSGRSKMPNRPGVFGPRTG